MQWYVVAACIGLAYAAPILATMIAIAFTIAFFANQR